ncbi:MAG: Trm112 family protein [Actinomycetota bacterium]|nr:Trm112 family protein [Actinomycetota bacterium]
MALDSLLIELLVCPEDKGPLWYFEEDALLYNPRLRRRYPVRDGIPVLLIAEGETTDDVTHAALAERFAHSGVETGTGPIPGEPSPSRG